jgi:hypothetical protein
LISLAKLRAEQNQRWSDSFAAGVNQVPGGDLGYWVGVLYRFNKLLLN